MNVHYVHNNTLFLVYFIGLKFLKVCQSVQVLQGSIELAFNGANFMFDSKDTVPIDNNLMNNERWLFMRSFFWVLFISSYAPLWPFKSHIRMSSETFTALFQPVFHLKALQRSALSWPLSIPINTACTTSLPPTLLLTRSVFSCHDLFTPGASHPTNSSTTLACEPLNPVAPKLCSPRSISPKINITVLASATTAEAGVWFKSLVFRNTPHHFVS